MPDAQQREWEQALQDLLERALRLWLEWSLRDSPSASQSALDYAKRLEWLGLFVLRKPRSKEPSSFAELEQQLRKSKDVP